jgi:hypothetical protein
MKNIHLKGDKVLRMQHSRAFAMYQFYGGTDCVNIFLFVCISTLIFYVDMLHPVHFKLLLGITYAGIKSDVLKDCTGLISYAVSCHKTI